MLFTSFTGNIYADSNKKSQIPPGKTTLVAKDNTSVFNLMKNLISQDNSLLIDTMPNTYPINFIYGIHSPYIYFSFGYNMETFLPGEGININELFPNGTRHTFDKWVDDFKGTYVLQQLTESKIYHYVGLNPLLKSLEIFDNLNPERVNFTKLTTNDTLSQTSLYINKIKHKLYIPLYKEGTEADFTAEIINRTSTPYYNELICFNVDKPFFIIKNNKTEVISFTENISN